MFWNVKEETISVKNMPITHIQFGSGSKHLMLIQGLNTRGIHGSVIPLAYMYRIFAKKYTIHVLERRPVITEEITVRDMADDLAAAMDALKIQKADVFGVSQGGMLAQYLAIDRPDLVHKLVLAVTLSRTNETVQAVISHWIALCTKGDTKQMVSDMMEKMYSKKYRKRYEPFIPLLAIVQKPKDEERFRYLANACLTCDTYDLLDQIHCPIFVIGGKKDAIVSGQASMEIAEKLKCPLFLYEDLGHAAYEEAKDFNRRVYAFFEEAL